MSGAFAELFVSLGIKGSEKTLSVLSSVKTGMGGIRDTSLAAKAAILATIYAIEKMASGSANFGYNIQNLATYLDIGTKSLQQWRYAALQAGISNDEFDRSALSIKQHIKEANAKNHILPDGSAILAQETHFDFSKKFKINDILPALLEFARNKKYSNDVIETILEGWGLTPTEISQAIKGKFSAANLKNADILSGKEIGSLSNTKVEFGLIEQKAKMFMGHFTAEHGEDAVKNLNNMESAFLRIATDLDKISTKIGVFRIIGQAFQGWNQILNSVADDICESRIIDIRNDLENWILPTPEENKKLFSDIQQAAKINLALKQIDNMHPMNDFLDSSKNHLLSGYGEAKTDLSQMFFGKNKNDWQNQLNNLFDYKNIVPSQMPMMNQTGNDVTINQNISFQHPGVDAGRTKSDLESVSRQYVAALRSQQTGRVT